MKDLLAVFQRQGRPDAVELAETLVYFVERIYRADPWDLWGEGVLDDDGDALVVLLMATASKLASNAALAMAAASPTRLSWTRWSQVTGRASSGLRAKGRDGSTKADLLVADILPNPADFPEYDRFWSYLKDRQEQWPELDLVEVSGTAESLRATDVRNLRQSGLMNALRLLDEALTESGLGDPALREPVVEHCTQGLMKEFADD